MSDAPRKFLKRGQGSEKYQIKYPVLTKAGLQQASNKSEPQACKEGHEKEMHYASSPIVPQRPQSTTAHGQTSQRVPRLNIPDDEFSLPSFDPIIQRSSSCIATRTHTDSERCGEGKTLDLRSTDKRLLTHSTSNMHQSERYGNTPIYGPSSDRTNDSGFVNAQQLGSGSEVNALLTPRPQEESLSVTRSRFDVSNDNDNDELIVNLTHICDREDSSHFSAGLDGRRATYSHSLVSFEQHEKSAITAHSPSDSLSTSTTQYTHRTRLGSRAAKRDVKLSDNLPGLPSSTRSTSSSNDTPNSNTSGAISSIRPSTDGSGFSLSPSGQRQQRRRSADSNPVLEPRRALQDVVPSISQLNREPLRSAFLPSQATQLSQPKVNPDDMQTPLVRPKNMGRARAASLSRIVDAPEPGLPQRAQVRAPTKNVQRDHRSQQSNHQNGEYRPIHENLTEQLRDTIINLDFVEAAYRNKYEGLMKKLQNELAIVTRDKEEWQSHKKVEEERLKREWDTVRREKRSMRLTETEREKEMQQKNDEQKNLVDRLTSQLAKLRLKLKEQEDTIKEQRKELDDGKTVKVRQEKRILVLENKITTLKRDIDKEVAKLVAEARSKDRLKPGLLRASAPLNRSLPQTSSHGSDPAARPDANIPGMHGNLSKFVKWADDRNGMRFQGSLGMGTAGAVDIYRSVFGSTTKVSQKPCGCQLMEYSTNEIRYLSADKNVQVYYYTKYGTHVVTTCDITVILYKTRQFEIHRKSGEISTVHPIGKLVEIIRRGDGTLVHEIFELSKLASEQNFARQDGEIVRVFPDHIEWHLLSGIRIWFSSGETKIGFDTSHLNVSLSAIAMYAVMKHKNMDPQGKAIKINCFSWGNVPSIANSSLINSSLTNAFMNL